MGAPTREVRYVVTQDMLDQVAMTAAQQGVKAYKSELKKTERRVARENDKVGRTKKMLDSYRRVKAAMAEETELSDDEKIEFRWKFIEDLMGDVKHTVTKSERAVSDEEKRRNENRYSLLQIEKAAKLYRDECEQIGTAETLRRYREFSMMYLDDEIRTVQEIAEIEAVSDKTVYKDLGISCKIVSVYLLGI